MDVYGYFGDGGTITDCDYFVQFWKGGTLLYYIISYIPYSPSFLIPNVDLICVSFDVCFLDPCPRRILH